MTLRQLGLYLGHIPTITAKEAMTQSTIASIPYMDEEARAAVYRSWSMVADIEMPEPDKISMDDFRNEIKQRIA